MVVIYGPASISISAIGFPLGSYIGFASRSIFDVLTAGYEEPGRGGVAVAVLEASILIAGEGEGFTCSFADTFAGEDLDVVDRGG